MSYTKMTQADETLWIKNWWFCEGQLDSCSEDVTTDSLLTVAPQLEERRVPFYLIAKNSGVFSGQKFLDWIAATQGEWKFEAIATDGARLEKGQIFVRGTAPLHLLLARERMILNMLQHLSGIATATAELVSLVKANWKFFEAPPSVLHTRKFLPGLREWQAQACLHGGGESHRLSLSDRILFKDNHKKFLRLERVALPSYYASLKKIDETKTALIEVESVAEAMEAVECGVQHLLLDNFGPELMQEFFKKLPKSSRVSLELSGNLTAERLPGLLIDARIRRLSFGSITHSVRALDISLEAAE